ncbi:MFS general substrate transporter [Microthyrium microscopicum]|uniref:MFS general substrate transporter n=1 Tax=Microthyrium microscopicum TaxID=703497 RepID=A0A6A6TW04_9PEZI|nr:MFS general substrate transporter [Microthyrium microscopicum]
MKATNITSNDEHTPLLESSSSSIITPDTIKPPAEESDIIEEDDKTFNKTQVLLLALCRMVDPIAFFCIVPFINQMIFDITNIEEEDVGFYSGMIESLFSVVAMITMVPYGRLADRFGRKPVLVWSLAGVSVTCTLFGFSKTLWQMIVLRCLAGFFSGSVVSIRTMISENSTPTTQAAAFSWFAFFGNIGIFVGTLIGGLADPAAQYKGIFAEVRFFRAFPYALPTIISGSFVLIALLIAIFFVNETRDVEKSRKRGPEPSTWEVIRSPGVPNVLIVWCLCSMLGFAFTAVAPVFWFTSVEAGGFALTPQYISYFLAVAGISQAMWMLLVFPRLQPRIGTGALLRYCAILWPFLFALNPVANMVLRAHHDTVFWVVAPIATGLGSGCAMAFTASQIAVNDIAPSPGALGTINGIALSLSSGMRSFTPALFTSIFAIGVKDQIFGGYLVWIVMIGVTLLLGLALYWLPAKINEIPMKKASEQPSDDEEATIGS